MSHSSCFQGRSTSTRGWSGTSSSGRRTRSSQGVDASRRTWRSNVRGSDHGSSDTRVLADTRPGFGPRAHSLHATSQQTLLNTQRGGYYSHSGLVIVLLCPSPRGQFEIARSVRLSVRLSVPWRRPSCHRPNAENLFYVCQWDLKRGWRRCAYFRFVYACGATPGEALFLYLSLAVHFQFHVLCQ